ncbi:Uncharacterized protein SCF082_LOCUS9349 [Durusdinium trenchii]|uniref:Uncharacterized protein n=1 Tax=Durusdinium trenchii TaxID=1381693 RepID=A0ABP0IYI9_9DINO
MEGKEGWAEEEKKASAEAAARGSGNDEVARGLFDDGLVTPRGPAGSKGVTVSVQVGPCLFQVPIGEGAQDVRWLGLVASQRYQAFVEAKAKIGNPDECNLDAGFYLPQKIQFAGSDVDPSANLGDLLESFGAKHGGARPPEPQFRVDLCREVVLGNDGAPELQEWQARAFCHSEAGKAHVETQRARQDPAEVDEGTGCGDDVVRTKSRQGQFLGPGVFAPFDGPEQVAVELEKDWAKVRAAPQFEAWFSLQSGEGLDEDKEQDVKLAVLNNFQYICQVIDFYAWVWQRDGDENLALTPLECEHMLTQTGLINTEAYPDLLRECLENVVPSDAEFVERHHVLLILLHIAAAAFQSSLIVSEVERLFQEDLKPIVLGFRALEKDDPVRGVLYKSNVARIFRSSRKKDRILAQGIQEAFHQFCIGSVSEGREPSMTLQEFALFFADGIPSDIGLLEADDGQSAAAAEEAKTESKMASSSSSSSFETVERLATCQRIFDKAQNPDPARKESKPHKTLCLAEFVCALLLVLYERGGAQRSEAWRSRLGARTFLELAQFLADEFIN